MAGTIVQVSISRGGVPKLPVLEAEIGEQGLAGDRQRDLRNHGGPERAVCLYAAERIAALRAEGHPIAPGTAGENITTAGIDWDRVKAGVRLRLGADVVLEVTRPTSPCTNIAGSFAKGDFVRISEKVNPGWSRVYARVITGGTVRPGDTVALEEA